MKRDGNRSTVRWQKWPSKSIIKSIIPKNKCRHLVIHPNTDPLNHFKAPINETKTHKTVKVHYCLNITCQPIPQTSGTTFATYMYKKYKISGTAPSGVTVNIPHFAKRIIEYLGTTP